MKKTISICLCVAVLTGAGIFIGISEQQAAQKNEAEQPSLESVEYVEETEMAPSPELAESMAIPENYAYVIYEKDGVLMVYEKDGKTEYFETNIRVRDLEEKMLENLQKGIYFETEEALYDFLESYSS